MRPSKMGGPPVASLYPPNHFAPSDRLSQPNKPPYPRDEAQCLLTLSSRLQFSGTLQNYSNRPITYAYKNQESLHPLVTHHYPAPVDSLCSQAQLLSTLVVQCPPSPDSKMPLSSSDWSWVSCVPHPHDSRVKSLPHQQVKKEQWKH